MTGRSIWPVVVVMCLVVVVAGAGWQDSTAANGIFVYALDDAYIHLTIGRTLAEHGVWGVSPREFSSASSSPLWTIILALWCRLFGVSDLAPLALNVLFGCLLIAVSDSLLCRSWAGYAGRSWHRFAFLCALMFAIPMPALILSGMEHLLHTLLAVLFALKAAEYLWPSPDTAKPPMGFFTLAGIAALTVAARYESMALVAPVFLVLAWRRRWSEAVPLGLASLLPVTLFGIYSISNNMPFVPASILVKTIGLAQGIPAWFLYTPLVKAVMRILICPSLLVMMTLGTYSLFRAWREPSAASFRNAGAAGLFVLASLIHADFVGVGWFYRYEAY
nr:hypothetical protein [Candidatus Ozemobacteraceae bacterium]